MGKFRVDDWVLFCTFPDATSEMLANERERAVVLAELNDDFFYDYRIIIEKQEK